MKHYVRIIASTGDNTTFSFDTELEATKFQAKVNKELGVSYTDYGNDNDGFLDILDASERKNIMPITLSKRLAFSESQICLLEVLLNERIEYIEKDCGPTAERYRAMVAVVREYLTVKL